MIQFAYGHRVPLSIDDLDHAIVNLDTDRCITIKRSAVCGIGVVTAQLMCNTAEQCQAAGGAAGNVGSSLAADGNLPAIADGVITGGIDSLRPGQNCIAIKGRFTICTWDCDREYRGSSNSSVLVEDDHTAICNGFISIGVID